MNKLFVIDGQNKSGKGTQVSLLTDRLNREGFPTVSIREPGGTDVGEKIRAILLNSAIERPQITDVLLFNAARAATVKRIGELLTEKTVVSDRSYISTLAFQMHGDGAPEASTRAICEYAIGPDYKPDAFFVLDIPFETYAARKNHTDEDDYFERERGYFEKVREGFLVEARRIGAIVVDGTKNYEEIHNRIWESITPILD